ncbi:unnamed protein product [Macrosiphum euphorbiae]|uniref:Transposase n=1 Tax=Macrosiphum euphorbiae TaxID=13131 RepID=A0AAV0Y6M2_9HEMI|nr:unnamed protein product [Macrosiphum euphorbiae]
MESVYTVFDINDKIVFSTTDNGSNFVKSFKVYESDDFDISDENTDGTAYVNIADLFDEAEDIDYILPKHHRCAAHTLNLIATNDIEKELASVKSKSLTLWNYKQQCRATFAKANNLWNKQNRYTQVADSIKECFDCVTQLVLCVLKKKILILWKIM